MQISILSKIGEFVEKMTNLEIAKRKYFYMEKKSKEKKHTPLLGLLSKHKVSTSKINTSIKWINNIWK